MTLKQCPKNCFCLVSNQGPFAFKANVITTTVQKPAENHCAEIVTSLYTNLIIQFANSMTTNFTYILLL